MTAVPQYVSVQNLQPHERIAIRNWVKLLMKANTDLGERWFASRPNPMYFNEVPCGLIYFSDESADHGNTAPRNYKRELSLTIEVMHQMDSERDNALDDWLDSRAYEVERAMLADRFLGLQGIVEDCALVRTQPVTIESEGTAQDVGSIRLFFDITYHTGFANNQKLDEFLKFINKIETTDGAESQDNVTIREE